MSTIINYCTEQKRKKKTTLCIYDPSRDVLRDNSHYTWSLFYLTNILCHFLPLFRLVGGHSVEWAALMQQASLQEMPDDIFQIK